MKNWQSGKTRSTDQKVKKKAKNRGTRDFFDQKLHMKKMRILHFLHFLQICKTAFEWSTKVRIKKTHNLT
jgi:hypothetical protein